MQIFAASYLIPVSTPPVRDGGIVVEHGRIVATGPLTVLTEAYRAPVTRFPGCVLMPGLVNAHTHLELTHFPAWKLRKGIDYSPRTYTDWVVQVIKIKRALSHDELATSLREGIRKSLEAGTTAVGEIVTDQSLLVHHRASPLRGRLLFEAIGHDSEKCFRFKGDLLAILDDMDLGNFRPGISPHAPHTLSPQFLDAMVSVARTYDLPLVTHLSESPEEGEFLHDSTGRIAELLYPLVGWDNHLPPPRRTTSAAYLDEHGVFNPATAAVHAVHLTPSDAEIIKKRGSSVILCPRSNDRLAVGTAPASLLKKLSIPLALGTDSLASNDSLSLWDEMRFLRHTFPGLFSPSEVLRMSTLDAARVLRVDDESGSLDQGKFADFILVQTERTSAGVEGEELYELLIEEGRVEEVFIGGKKIL